MFGIVHGDTNQCVVNVPQLPPVPGSVWDTVSTALAPSAERGRGTSRRVVFTDVILLFVCLSLGSLSECVGDAGVQVVPAFPPVGLCSPESLLYPAAHEACGARGVACLVELLLCLDVLPVGRRVCDGFVTDVHVCVSDPQSALVTPKALGPRTVSQSGASSITSKASILSLENSLCWPICRLCVSPVTVLVRKSGPWSLIILVSLQCASSPPESYHYPAAHETPAVACDVYGGACAPIACLLMW